MASLSPYRFFLIVFLISHATLFIVSRAEGDPKTVEDHFHYHDKEGRGPSKWGTLKEEWETCGKGKSQSPIDLTNPRVQHLPRLSPLEVRHKAGQAKVVNRGHDILLEWEGDAGSLRINGTDYELLNIHWHSPSEHTINGKRYDMEGHMVHKSADSRIAVIGILYKIGKPDRFLQKLMPAIKTVGKNGTRVGIVAPGETKFNRNGYYRYLGSLTTPPCTEGVIWSVVTKVRSVSTTQLEALKEAVHDGYEANARPIQEYNEGIKNLTADQ